MKAVLRLDGVRFVRNRRAILDDISWAVLPGEHWAMLGANGSGKTTLLKIVTGYEWATSGTIDVLGERLGATDVRALRRRVGWVSTSIERRLPSEDKSIEVVLSGLESTIGVYSRFDDAEKERALSMLESVGGGPLARARYGVLSQGEQQRVLIARALVSRPSILILDEPCAGLDPAAREHFLADLARMATTPQAPVVVFVTHHIEEIGPWINRVLVLKQGTVLAHGTPREALTSTILSQAFSLPCTVRNEGNAYRLHMGAG